MTERFLARALGHWRLLPGRAYAPAVALASSKTSNTAWHSSGGFCGPLPNFRHLVYCTTPPSMSSVLCAALEATRIL